MKAAADQHRRAVEFVTGELVYLKMRPYRRKSLAHFYNEKLIPRYYGPFEIIAKVGPVAYRLKLLPESQIHPVFHVSQLRKVVGKFHLLFPLPQHLGIDWELKVELGSVLGIHTATLGNDGMMEVLIKWVGLSPMEAAWDCFDIINQQFPSFHIANKVTKLGGVIDRPQSNTPILEGSKGRRG